ncbi:hypothetical protein MCOR27_003472 [Pyricularia oryzae]|uniref:Uncharacterized protein n=2 Tax=Pyricularia TaxID=48558 RepID=A0ABQ8N7W2_PYRGI|nr:hypothetical protein MCOR01_005347 [Pyricularia oryzae]KAI6292697.1 hypothetical protein MCOR33_009677 [Pyricularia grisea]KAH9427732.1 hypothetical protein MCOR02_011964 [Pyricularia oryzae]KAI6255584.1 hypothetical protein MCOR19_007932 [Pyricularia oryzae]KAI6281113.1 hypothetical protein MCOR34_011145 [Pyricularia oryzae]
MVLAKILAIATILALSPGGALAGPPGSVDARGPERPVSADSPARPCKVTILMAVSPGGYFRQIYGEGLTTRGGRVVIESFKCTVDETCNNPSCPDVPPTWQVTSYDVEKKLEGLGEQGGESVWGVGKKHEL